MVNDEKKWENYSTQDKILFILSWVTFISGFVIVLYGVSLMQIGNTDVISINPSALPVLCISLPFLYLGSNGVSRFL